MSIKDLREVSITFKGSDAQFGKFHKWFEKRYDDGTSSLFAVVELDKDGAVALFGTDDYDITFVQHTELLDDNSAEDAGTMFW